MSTSASGGFGTVTLAALVAANMIGAGVFTTSGFSLADLGSPRWVLVAWAVGGAIALCGAIGYGALARFLTESGGEYLFLSRFVHPAAGFLAGWVSLLAGFTGAIAFAAHAFESYVRPPDSPLPEGSIAVATVLVAAIAHGLRARPGALGQNFVVGIKLLLILGFLAWSVGAAFTRPPASLAASLEPFSLGAFAGSLVWISLSYSGFNAAVYVAGEAREPRITVPRAMLIATAVVTAIYLGLNAVFVGFVPVEVVSGRPDVAAAAAEALLGERGAALVRWVAALALLSSVSSMMMAGPRVFAKMADDGLFPARLRLRGETPRHAIFMQAVLACVVIVVSDLQGLLSYLGLTLSLSAALTVGCVFPLRRRHGAAAVPVAGSVVLPGVFVVATLGLAGLSVAHDPSQVVGTGFTIVSGGLLYLSLRPRLRGARGRHDRSAR